MTAERSKLMKFVSPAYYSSGVALFAPGGQIEGVRSWSNLAGRTLAVKEGNYVLDAAPQTPALQNVTLVQVPNIQGGLFAFMRCVEACTCCLHSNDARACVQCGVGVLSACSAGRKLADRPIPDSCPADAAALVAAGDVDGYLE